jgi:hypothetical protein
MERFSKSVQNGRPYIRDSNELLRSYKENQASRSLYGEHWDDIPRSTRVLYATNSDIKRRHKQEYESEEHMNAVADIVSTRLQSDHNRDFSDVHPTPILRPSMNDVALKDAINSQQVRFDRPKAMQMNEWYYLQSKKY